MNFPEIRKMLMGRDPQECLDKGICIFCGGEAKIFKDELSRREFAISQCCQTCQDEVFEGEDDDDEAIDE